MRKYLGLLCAERYKDSHLRTFPFKPARPRLIITIPDMMRGQVGHDYLYRTLEALYDEIGENNCLVQVVVVFNDREGQTESAFQNASRFLRAKYSELFIAENKIPARPLLEEEVYFWQRLQAPARPLQALNLAFMLSRQFSRSEYLLLMEDDFVLCSEALRLILCIIRTASRVKHDWKAMHKDVPSMNIRTRTHPLARAALTG